MTRTLVGDAIESLEKSNADLETELLRTEDGQALLEEYVRARKLADYGIAALGAKLDNATKLAQVTGTSIGKARETVATGKVLRDSQELNVAMRVGEVSLDQATEIAKAEESAPGAAAELIAVAKENSFQVLKDKARATKLEAEQHRGLADRQHGSRCARSYTDDLGMINIHLALEPHVGAPLVTRAEAEAQRIARAATDKEPFERYLADAYVKLLGGSGKGRSTRPELVVLVSQEVAKRGWTEVRSDEVCKIPGVGPIAAQAAKAIATEALISAVISDGKNLQELKSFGRYRPKYLQIALELGDPSDFDGVRCVDCGNHFRNEFDHVEPKASLGPTSLPNIDPRCWTCHQAKTKRDRDAGKLKPQRGGTGKLKPQPGRPGDRTKGQPARA